MPPLHRCADDRCVDALCIDAQMTDEQKMQILKTTLVVPDSRSRTLVLPLHEPLDEGAREKMVSAV